MKKTNALRSNWESLSSYIPVLLMLAFAMMTYWLLQITPKASTKETQSAPVHEEDYFMSRFSVKTYEKNGQIKTYVLGNYARHFPDTDTIEIDGPRIYTQSTDKSNKSQKAEGSAKTASSNSDATEIELKGNVVLIKQDLVKGGQPVVTRIAGEYLKINSDIEQISSTKPIEIEKGSQKMYANSMNYDNLDRHFIMSGNVRVVFAAKQ